MHKTKSKSSIMKTYNRIPINLIEGKGSYVWDDEGKKYLDFTAGIGTYNLGHLPDRVYKKVTSQMDLLWHCSNLYGIENQEELANLLTENGIMDKVFFCNSGAEANEAAIKIAKKYAKDNGNTERIEIVTFKQSFHGRTGAAMAATAQEKIHEGFTPLTPGFRYLTLNDDKALEDIQNGKTTAVLVELVQGEGGVHPVDTYWIKQLEEICKKNDILLMVDEVQTGIGRTGTLFAYEQYGVEPDVITLAKGLGSGIPIGAMLATEKVAESFQAGTHGSTFGGNPLVTAAGVATIQTVLEENILENVKKNSSALKVELNKLQNQFSTIQDVRMLGLLVGIELKEEASSWITKFREKGILVLSAGANVLRILPPLNVTWDEIEKFLVTFQALLEETEEVIL